MSHLPDIPLKAFQKGQGLVAADLNANFAALLGAIDATMHAALTPDPVGVGNEVKIAAHDKRLAALEGMVQMHARQRNEKEWAPLAYVAGLMQLMLEIRGPLHERSEQLFAAQGEARALHAGLLQRVARLEQQPESATQEDFEALAAEFKRVADKEHMLLAQVIALRHEVGLLREMAMGHARKRNEMEYAPLSTVGHLLTRIKELEARTP